LVVNIQSALAALDFTYYNQENCHIHAITCYVICPSRCYAAL